MVTLFHTLLHFVTLNHTIFHLSACAAASTRIQGVSKSHLLSIYACKRIYANPVQRGLYTHAILNPREVALRNNLCVYGSSSSVKKLTLCIALYYSLAARMPLHYSH